MSVNPVDGTSTWAATQQASGQQSTWQNVINAAAGALGENASTLQQQLQSGSSLSSIAQSQGVSQQTLIQAVSSALTQGSSSSLSSSQAQQIATNLVNRVPGGHHHHHHHHAAASSTDTQSTDDQTQSGTQSDSTGTDSSTLTNFSQLV